MGLNRIVTLFHSKLNTLGADNRRGFGSVSSSVSSSSSASEVGRHEDCDSSSTTMSLTSSMESLMSSGVLMASASPLGKIPVMHGAGFPVVVRGDENNNNSGSSCNGSTVSLNRVAAPPMRRLLNSSGTTSVVVAKGIECNVRNCGEQVQERDEDLILVLGTEGVKSCSSPVNSACKQPRKVARRFSVKGKFSSDLDLYGNMSKDVLDGGCGGGGGGTGITGSSSSLLMQGRRQKKTIWSSLRLPIRLIKGNEGIERHG